MFTEAVNLSVIKLLFYSGYGLFDLCHCPSESLIRSWD